MADDRRQHVRVKPDANNALAARLSSGADVRLIDLSRGGAQFECERRFLPNSIVSLRLMTRDDVVVVTGRVVRSRIVRLATGGLGYVVAVAFNHTLTIPIEPEPRVEPAEPDAGAWELSSAEASAPVQAHGPVEPASHDETPLPDALADISAEEALAFESALEAMPPMFTLTAAVDATSDQLRDMFNGNDW